MLSLDCARFLGGDGCGGVVDDYLSIHDWLDSTKESFADFPHRALRHHSQGIIEAERVFGHAIRNTDGKLVPVRYICEQHIKEDCGGFIPTVADWFRHIKPESWMSRGYRIEPAAEPCTPILPTRQLLTPRPRQQQLTPTPHPEPASGRFSHPANPLNSQLRTDTPLARNIEIRGSLAEGDC